MGGDDEVAVVQYAEKWYVKVVHGSNAWIAIEKGVEFLGYNEALAYAHSIKNTEYMEYVFIGITNLWIGDLGVECKYIQIFHLYRQVKNS